MPYCDAMFIDGQHHARLRELPKGHLDFPAKIFSYAHVDEFVAWAKSIAAEVSQAQRDALRQHYGVDPDALSWS